MNTVGKVMNNYQDVFAESFEPANIRYIKDKLQ